ncbi:Retinoblastoma-like protein [Trichinella spiralis]|uniref:Retinoblastoma-like protein n=1 Tax=Trichinella spiralis TaxID=6334 RepID=A0ABR3KUK8_TRISP
MEGATEENLELQFRELCKSLSLGDARIDIAWRGFEAVRRQCLLSDDPMKWLACSVYVACWLCSSSVAPPADRKALPVDIMKTFNVPIVQFFDSIVKWVDMANMTPRSYQHVVRLENSFAVSTVLFSRFLSIFSKLISTDDVKISSADGGEYSTPCKKLKSNNDPVTSQSMKEFAWLLWIYIRKSIGGISDNLIHGFNLLLCMFDTVISNVSLVEEKELFKVDSLPTCDGRLLDALCLKFDAVVMDVKFARAEWRFENVHQFAHRRQLPVQLGLVAQAYEELLLKKGDLDERIFLNEVDYSLLQSGAKKKSPSRTPDKSESTSHAEFCLSLVKPVVMRTPLSCRYPPKQQDDLLLVDGDNPRVSEPVAALQAMIDSYRDVRDGFLRIAFSQVTPNPMCYVFSLMDAMGEEFINAYKLLSKDADDLEHSLAVAVQRRHCADGLFQRLLTKIVRTERNRSSILDLSEAIVHEEFVFSLYAVCVELVLFTYGSGDLFPWAMENVVHQTPFHFYKVIEVVIKNEKELSRDCVKHLNIIEERILEELVWEESSPLWTETGECRVPTSVEISSKSPRIMHYYRPVQKFAFARNGRPICRRLEMNRTSSIRFNSTLARPTGGSSAAEHMIKISTVNVAKKPIPAMAITELTNQEKSQSVAEETRSPSSTITMFFKKLYYLISIRLNDLCDRFRVAENVKLQTWALIERVLCSHMTLLKGRHLDQIIMCCLGQPQAKSRVYRCVRLDPATTGNNNNSKDDENDEVVPQQQQQQQHAITSHVEYGDITEFYNRNFIDVVRGDIASMLQTDSEGGEPTPPVSPFPTNRLMSVTKKSVTCGIYLSPLKVVPPVHSSPIRPMRYSFYRSSIRDLKMINTMMDSSSERGVERVGPPVRRALFGRGAPEPPTQRKWARPSSTNL